MNNQNIELAREWTIKAVKNAKRFKDKLPSDSLLTIKVIQPKTGYDEWLQEKVMYRPPIYQMRNKDTDIPIFETMFEEVLESDLFLEHMLEIDDILKEQFGDYRVVALRFEPRVQEDAFYTDPSYSFDRKINYSINVLFAKNQILCSQSKSRLMYGLWSPRKVFEELVDWQELEQDYQKQLEQKEYEAFKHYELGL